MPKMAVRSVSVFEEVIDIFDCFAEITFLMKHKSPLIQDVVFRLYRAPIDGIIIDSGGVVNN